MSANKQQAFILRIAPSEVDHVPEALQQNQLIIGWANATGLLDPELDWERFRSFGVTLWPTLVFLKDGREISRVVRPIDAAGIRKALADIDHVNTASP
jgi:hypothetical protein